MPADSFDSALGAWDAGAEAVVTTVVPEDFYPIEVTAAEAGVTKARDKHQLILTIKITDGPYRDITLKHRLTLTKDNAQAIGFFFRDLGALGVTREIAGRLPWSDTETFMRMIAQMLPGRQARVKIITDVYEGDPVNKIRKFLDSTLPQPPIALPTSIPGPSMSVAGAPGIAPIGAHPGGLDVFAGPKPTAAAPGSPITPPPPPAPMPVAIAPPPLTPPVHALTAPPQQDPWASADPAGPPAAPTLPF
jgi:hypothetical protein